MCIFCNIADGKIPAYKVYEDDNVLAFLYISQVTKGHTLVIPKKHFDNFLDCDSDTLNKVMGIAQKIGKQLQDKLDCQGFNILSNINEVAGQSVKHFHVHVIPRYSEEDACIIKFETSDEQDLPKLLEIING